MALFWTRCEVLVGRNLVRAPTGIAYSTDIEEFQIHWIVFQINHVPFGPR